MHTCHEQCIEQVVHAFDIEEWFLFDGLIVLRKQFHPFIRMPVIAGKIELYKIIPAMRLVEIGFAKKTYLPFLDISEFLLKELLGLLAVFLIFDMTIVEIEPVHQQGEVR